MACTQNVKSRLNRQDRLAPLEEESAVPADKLNPNLSPVNPDIQGYEFVDRCQRLIESTRLRLEETKKLIADSQRIMRRCP